MQVVEAATATQTGSPAPEQFIPCRGDSPSAGQPAPFFREGLTFRLGEEEFGVDILCVQEIRGYETPTRIAGAPPHVKGVLNLRGVIVPVVDLRACLGLDQAACDALTVIIVLNVAGQTVGAIVDAVRDVVELAAEQVKPVPMQGTSTSIEHLVGIGTIRQGEQERMLILMDIERLLARPDMGLRTLNH